jgi:hypothetical protein
LFEHELFWETGIHFSGSCCSLETQPSSDVFDQDDDREMKMLAVILVLVLLTISGVALTNQLLKSDQHAAQRAN